MRRLPAIAKDEVPKDGDRQAFLVLARDESGKAVYSAALTFAGLRLGAQQHMPWLPAGMCFCLSPFAPA